MIITKKLTLWAASIFFAVATFSAQGVEEAARQETKSVEMMTPEEQRAVVHNARKNKNWVLLGIHGELYSRVLETWPSMGDLLIVPVGNEKSLVTYDELTKVARIKSDGVIEKRDDYAPVTRMTSFPESWPLDQEGRPLDRLPLGTILVAKSKKTPLPTERPKEAIGWVVRLIDDGIFMPDQAGERSENILWLIPEGDGGFKLIHSGPAYKGLFMAVDSERKITYGEVSDEIEKRAEGQRYWIDRSYENGKKVLFSEGNTASLRGSADPKELFVFHDGLPYSYYRSREY